MTKYPFMPFYVADFQADTMHLNWKEKAAYRALLDAYWVQGSGPKNDDKRLARIIGMTPEEWAEVRENVLEFFTIEDGSLVQKRIETEIAKAKQITDTAKEKAAKRWKKQEKAPETSHGNAPAMPQHSTGNAEAMPSTSTSTVTGEEASLGFEAEFEEFAGAEESAPEIFEDHNPAEYQTPPDDFDPAIMDDFEPTAGPVYTIPPTLKLPPKDLNALVDTFGPRSQEAIDAIARQYAAKDYGYKNHWAGAKTWFAKEPSPIAWLDKATGKAPKPWEKPAQPPPDTRTKGLATAAEKARQAEEMAGIDVEGLLGGIPRRATG